MYKRGASSTYRDSQILLTLIELRPYPRIYFLRYIHSSLEMAGKSFIVTLKESVPDADVSKFKDSIRSLNGSITHEFSLIKGYTVHFPESLHANKLKDSHNSIIANIEEDKEVHTQ